MSFVNRALFPFAWAFFCFSRLRRRIRECLLASLFHKRGRNLRFDPDGYYTFQNIELGNDVILGRGAVLMAAKSKIIIGNKVMLGPGVMIIAGNHNSSVLGQAMFDVQEKRPEDDQDVRIEDDVWIGAGAILLKGVVIRRGAIIGAGAVVTSEVPPYAIMAGNPARLLRFRWNLERIIEHEGLLYPPSERLNPIDLQRASENSALTVAAKV